MRGEDAVAILPDGERYGSPPHARGRPNKYNKEVGEKGITPACAGKTATRIGPRRISGDHPRMRGEDSRRSSFKPKVMGSPPHARGRRFTVAAHGDNERITPACAGKTARQDQV